MYLNPEVNRLTNRNIAKCLDDLDNYGVEKQIKQSIKYWFRCLAEDLTIAEDGKGNEKYSK